MKILRGLGEYQPPGQGYKKRDIILLALFCLAEIFGENLRHTPSPTSCVTPPQPQIPKTPQVSERVEVRLTGMRVAY